VSTVHISLSECADRLAIAEVVGRYGVAVDTGDNDLYRSCFWPDAEFRSGTVTMVGEQFLDPLQRVQHAPKRQMTSLDRTTRSTHAMCGTTMDVTGGAAVATTTCIVHLLGTRDGDSAMVVRGITYVDRFARRESQWRIQQRRHEVHWMYDAQSLDIAPDGTGGSLTLSLS
jgi:hypothetical protein